MKSNEMRRVVWAVALLLCVCGAYVSFELSQRHIRGGFGADSLLGRMCEEGTASCDQVIKSPWGMIWGVPTAVWGLIYFTGFGLWYLLVGLPNRGGRWWQLAVIAGALVGLVIAAGLDYIMFAKLPSWCPLCFITHVTSLLLFVAAILMWPGRPKAVVSTAGPGQPAEAAPAAAPPFPAASPRAGRVGLSCVAILIAAALVHQDFLRRHHRAEEAQAKRTLAEWASSPARQGDQRGSAAPALRADDPVAGDPKAPDTVMVFSDFECPMCGGFANFWRREMLPHAAGKVRLVYRYFPMNTGCNPAVSTTVHELSCQAAEIAEAARLQGGNDAFWRMHDELFINQLRGKKRLSAADLAKKVGLDPVRLEQDRSSPRVRERIREDIETAKKMGVRGTPAVFLNGQLVQTSGPDPVWRRFLSSLAQATSAPATAPAAGCDDVKASLADCRARLNRAGTDWQSLVGEAEQAKVLPMALRADDPTKGNPKARRTVVVFSDFESPRCLEFAAYWLRRIEPYAMRRVRIVFRYYPMDAGCNPLVGPARSANSCESAAAAEAARMQGGDEAFWKMHDELFRNQVRGARLSYADMAKQIGLDVARFESDRSSPQVRARIQQDIGFGQQAGVKEVPAVFMNGRPIPVWDQDKFWQYVLNFDPSGGPTTAPATSRPAELR